VAATVRSSVARGEDLEPAIHAAHHAVLAEAAQRQERTDMGSTAVAVLLRGRDFQLGWVGDSRAYQWDGRLRLLSRDHNPVSELLQRGLITSEEAASHPERHVLTQCLGISEQMRIFPEVTRGRLSGQQQLLLCSDGLNDELSDAVIASHLAAHDTPQAQVDALVAAALAAGGRDNVTVIVLGLRESQPAGGDDATESQETGQVLPAVSPAAEGKSAARRWLLPAVLAALVIAAALAAF
jgi:protein phosphatase